MDTKTVRKQPEILLPGGGMSRKIYPSLICSLKSHTIQVYLRELQKGDHAFTF